MEVVLETLAPAVGLLLQPTANTPPNAVVAQLTAVIRALHATRHHKEIELHTDSQYVKNGMQIWVPQWKNNNWKTAAKKPVKNKELWQQLDELAASRKIHWVWVRGHAGNTYNERCDELARAAAEAMN